MLYDQKHLHKKEQDALAPYAIKSFDSKGRKHKEPEDPYRSAFQRDRDRIIHSKAFRRLSGKTQVFISSYGDHYRSRLTHSMEVAQVSRDIARSLGLNEDLCEVVALAHDLGHTPFGHAGEEAMNEMMLKFSDTFEHNEQSKRVVEILEQKSPDYPGLNLTFETLEGLMKHRRFHDDGKTPVIHSLEAQVVDLSDAIAYHHHDLDDGLRSGILEYEHLLEQVTLWQQATEELSMASLGEDLYRHIAINRVISILINDVIETSAENIRSQKIENPLSEPMEIIRFSEKTQQKVDQLADYLGEYFYLNERITSMSYKGQQIIKKLFQVYSQKDELLPSRVRKQFSREKRHVVIKDYIAGMTDEYATQIYESFKE